MATTIVISIDDLAQWIAPGGDLFGQVRTPNIDRIMGSGVTFANTFAAEALCNPSRTATMSGMMPDTTGVHSNGQAWYQHVEPGQTWMAQFLDAGATVGVFGKVFHGNMPASVANAITSENLPLSGYYSGAPATAYVQPLPPGLTEDDLADEIAMDAALDFLAARAPGEDVMLNVGLVKPHTSWVVPQAYFDLYPLDEVVVPGLVGEDMSDVPAFIREQLPHGPLPATADDARLWMQGYMASVSYADVQVGRLLDRLDATGNFDDSNIILWSDHGYHLGDHDGNWHKFTLWEEATRAPLVIKPAGNANAGTFVDDIVSLIDIYPTLTDLAGLPRPAHLEGDSLMPLVLGTGPAEGDGRAVTWMYGSAMLRSPKHAYILYEDGSEELYDMIADPRQLNNLAGDPAHARVQANMRERLLEKAGLYDVDGRWTHGTDANESFLLSHAGDGAAGGAGDDLYFVNATNVRIAEGPRGGVDTVFTDVDFTMPDNVENLLTKIFTAGAITVRGNGGANHISLDGPNQTAWLGGGDDRGSTIRSDNAIYGQNGNDDISGGPWSDRLDGGAGDDKINGGGGGADLLTGGAGDDLIQGGGEGTRMIGGSGNDKLLGGRGSQMLSGGDGADVHRGGAGKDWAVFNAARSAVTADLGNELRNRGEASGDRHVGIEGVIGSRWNDTFIGTSVANDFRGNDGNDRLYGKGGADALIGGAGKDMLIGGAGADDLHGGTGNDTAGYMDAMAGVVADLQGGARQSGDAKGDRFSDVENLAGSRFSDLLYGDGNANRIVGGDGADRLTGRGGNDRLTGGAGTDLFVFHTGSGRDVVTDFEVGVDHLVIKGWGFGTEDEVLNGFFQNGRHAVLESGEGRLTLLDVQVDDLSVGDIIV